MLEPKPLHDVQNIVRQKNYYNKALDYVTLNKAYQIINEKICISKSTLLKMNKPGKHKYLVERPLKIIELDKRFFVKISDIDEFIQSYLEAEKRVKDKTEFISLEEYAEKIGKSKRTVERMVKKDNIDTYLFKKTVYIKMR